MILIIGLGNPGKKYARNRHNAGFMLLDKLREAWDLPDFKLDKKFNAELSEGNLKFKIKNLKFLLVKPQTFMNLSGVALKKIMSFYKLKPADIIVAHDDLDIDLGKFKISADSRAAGHNGVQSIIDTLGTQKFKRIRIGIEGEEKRKIRVVPSEDFVLQTFTDDEIKKILLTFEDIISNFYKTINK